MKRITKFLLSMVFILVISFILSACAIKEISITQANFTLEAEELTYTGEALFPDVSVTHKTQVLKKDKDYTISYSNNLNVGTAKIVIEGKGNYSEQHELSFKIIKADLVGINAQNLTVEYDGNAHSLSITGVLSEDIITYSLSEEGPFAEENPTFIDVGTYQVYYKVTRGDNFNTLLNNAVISITNASSIEVSIADLSKTYDGEVAAWTVTNLKANDEIYYKLSEAASYLEEGVL
ncbi:MAG: hypothetical protein PHX62_04670, partial [Bacilli bacterium]|nr:hypothetical protein [Bacilli bacterium]